MKQYEDALVSYDKAIALKPDYAEAYYNRGNTLNDLKRYKEALASYDKAVALKANYIEAHNNRGTMLKNQKCHEDALVSYDKAIALRPDLAEAHYNRGNVLNELKRPEEALVSYDKAIALKPDFEFLLGQLLHTKMKICDWSNLQTQIAQCVHKIGRSEKVSTADLLRVAKRVSWSNKC